MEGGSFIERLPRPHTSGSLPSLRDHRR